MKYGESTFDILYLIFVITIGIQILRRAGHRTARLMGLAALILGFGDASEDGLLYPDGLGILSSFRRKEGIGRQKDEEV